MQSYTDLIKALRHCGKDLLPGERCKDSCPYGDIALCLPKLKLDAAAAIEELQAQLPKRGEWIWQDAPLFGNPYGSYKCKSCGCSMPHKTNYCPNCGAKMGGTE